MWDEIRKMKPIERRPDGSLFRLTPAQRKCVRKLTRKCCNNDIGNCLLLDDGETHLCPQAVADILLCRYFRRAILVEDPLLEKSILNPKGIKHCAICDSAFIGRSNHAKYCPDCAATVHRKQKARSARKSRARRGQIDA